MEPYAPRRGERGQLQIQRISLNAPGEAGRAVGRRDAAPTSASTGASGIEYNESGWGAQKYGGQTMRAAYSASNIPLMFAGTRLNANWFSKDKSRLLAFEAEGYGSGELPCGPFDLKQEVIITSSNIASRQQYLPASNRLNETGGPESQTESAFNTLNETAYALSGSVAPYSGPISCDNIISGPTSQIKS